MKIKFGAIITDGRGKIGGHVASKNRSGAYLRTKVTPVNPQTSYQTAVRASFGAFSQAWSGLTQVIIDGWNSAVNDWSKTDIFGDIKNPTGKNLYLRLNQQATQAGYPAIQTVPAKTDMVQGVITQVNYVVGETLTVFNRDISADARIIVFATPPLTQGTTFVKNKLRVIYTALNSTYSEIAASAAYNAKFGTALEGANIYFGFKYVMPNGQASPMQVLKADVTAA